MGRWVVIALLCGCGRLGFDARVASDGDAAATSGFTAVVANGDQVCATYEGALYCWGNNASDQLGTGSGLMRHGEPSAVNLPTGTLTSFAMGERHGCAIVDDELYCWGFGFDRDPAVVPFTAPPRFVDAGRDFTCVIADRLYCWGVNDSGQLGDTTTAPKLAPSPVATAIDFTAVDLGDDHACGIGVGGDVKCWGHNDLGTLGTGSFTPDQELSPIAVLPEIAALPKIAGWHACTLQAGVVRCWGRNSEGALGNDDTTDSADPVKPSLPVVDVIATGGGPDDKDSTCAASGGEVRCWGAGSFGRLGTGTGDDQKVPRLVNGLPGADVRELAIGYTHACARIGDGELWCWGRGTSGQLGDGTLSDSLIPVRVPAPR